MSAKVEINKPIRKTKGQEIVVDFDAEKLHAPFLLRCGALLIDYIFIVAVPTISLMIGRMMNVDGSKLLNNEITNAGWLIAILLGLTNFIIFPMFTGQSVGKMLTGLRVVRSDGSIPSLKNLILRYLVGYPLTILTCGFGFLVSVFNSSGRALHDYIAGTEVIYGVRLVKDR